MIVIDAPIYASAIAFDPPVEAYRPLTARNYSVAELMQMPQAWAVVVKHMPGVSMMVGNEQAKQILANMTIADFAVFTGANMSATLAAIDAELAQLPARGGQ